MVDSADADAAVVTADVDVVALVAPAVDVMVTKRTGFPSPSSAA